MGNVRFPNFSKRRKWDAPPAASKKFQAKPPVTKKKED